MKKVITLMLLVSTLWVNCQTMEWVLLPPGTSSSSSCSSSTDCGKDILCFGLKYTPSITGILKTYTTGFFITCTSEGNPIISNKSCVMTDTSSLQDVCNEGGFVNSKSSGQAGQLQVTKGVPVILHQICIKIPKGESIEIKEAKVTKLTTSFEGGKGETCKFTSPFTVDRDALCLDLCTKKPNTSGSALSTFTGISTLDRNVESTWVKDARSGFLKLESKTLGFVPTRVPNTNQITNPEEGMVVWNTTTQCLEYYDGTAWVCSSNKCK